MTALQQARKQIGVSLPVREYIVELVEATRRHPAIRFGASPRGSLSLMRAGQALAALRGRTYALPDDIKYLARPVLAHRLILQEAEQLRGQTPEQVLEEILVKIPIP
jgi:MoxR-like ATPase